MFALVSLAACLWSALRPAAAVSCEEARLRCAYRRGCGMALSKYVVGCSAVLHGDSPLCPEACQLALIALTSSEEGQQLMTCDCSDDLCHDSKQRAEICRPQVLVATRNETVVSCHVAQWICAADALCSTALDYYHRFCRPMFHGRKCTPRCNNSISILRRQEKAAKLGSCRCDGREEYDCPRIQANMARLCFHHEQQAESLPPTPARTAQGSGARPSATIWSALLVLVCCLVT
ncbi:growth arrest-specific protein 1-like [Bacillus rossius redtenbacheri]|uniref:growth arrest-specific protein 1-like n=1 Tax=Bacillus rossius redtenbacheri TaxID=93214 RepID=UPI002FDD77B4